MKIITNILFFFNATDRKKLLAMLFCILTMGFIEMLGIATILPFLAVVAKPEVVQTNTYLAKLFLFFSFSSTKIFILFLGGIVFSVLVAGNAFSAFTSWLTMQFCYGQGRKISAELLMKYLSQPYVFFLNRHSSDLSKNVVVEVDRLVVGIFINMMQSVAKLVMILCVLTLLLMIEPFLALSVMVILGGAYFIIYGLLRRKLAEAGRIASETSSVRYQVIHELMGAIKELKILGREQTFLQAFGNAAAKYAKAETLSQLSPIVTRYVIEMIAFGGMVLIALYLIGTREDISKFMPLLGLYALAGYRLMPAMQQLYAGFSSLRYHFSALEILHHEMQLAKGNTGENNQTVLSFEHDIKLTEIWYSYPYAEKAALSEITLTILKHSTVGIVGGSGGGKTTLVDIILGLLIPQKGVLALDGITVDPTNLRAWQRNIGYVPQNIFLLDASVTQNIALGVESSDIDQNAVERAARLANLHDFIQQDLPSGYETYIGEGGIRLSGGQRQRIGIARALYHDPDLLIFDEATSALDGATERVIMEAIRCLSHRKTIILVAHRLNTVKDCDVIYVLNQGRIVAEGTYSSLIETSDAFQDLASATT